MTVKTSRRKKKYVNSRVQGRILGRIASYWVLYHFVLWHGLFVYRYAQVRMTAIDGQAVGSIRSVYWQFCIDYSPLLVCSLLIMPLFMLDFVRLTHRFVGPLVRIRETLLKMMDNERVAEVEFRKGDLLPELQTTFVDFLAYYDQQRQGARNSTAHMHSDGRSMSDSQSRALNSVATADYVDEPAEAAAV